MFLRPSRVDGVKSMAGSHAVHAMWFKHHRRPSQYLLAAVVCVVIFFALLLPNSRLDAAIFGGYPSAFPVTHGRPSKPTPDQLNSLFLTEEQCRSTFPGLLREVDDAASQGPFRLRPTDSMLQGRIKDGKLFIINAQRHVDISQEMIKRRTAALYQLHRALVTSPSSLPDTIFGLTIEDSPFGASMSYSRPVDAYRRPAKPDARSFPMPHFVWWAWDLSFVGGMTRAMREVDAIEAEHAHRGKRKGRLGWWETKDRRAVWRGTTWFSSAQTPNMRGKLIQATKGKDWADVQALNWTHETAASSGRARPSSQSKEAKEATNALPISDFCRHRYIIYTEGVTYSGRLQLHQLCASVVLSPPIAWMQHTSHLIRPVFSSDLLAAQGRADGLVPDTHVDNNSTYPTARHRASWPSAATARSANDANMVFVAPDWSDLEATVAWLEEHPAVAAGIARRQRELFVGGGYFSAAAEACYWRGLIRGWAKVVRTGEETDDSGKGKREWPEGTPFEEWIMKDGNV